MSLINSIDKNFKRLSTCFSFKTNPSSDVIFVLAKDSSRVRYSLFTSSGVVAIPLALLAGGLVTFGLTLLSGRGGAADVEKIGAALVNVMDGKVAKAVIDVV